MLLSLMMFILLPTRDDCILQIQYLKENRKENDRVHGQGWTDKKLKKWEKKLEQINNEIRW